MTSKFIMGVYGEMGTNFLLIFDDVISCCVLDGKLSEVYHSVANIFPLKNQVRLHLFSL